MMANARRAVIAEANECGRTSRRAPTLGLASPRELLLDWLTWADPNGRWSDNGNTRDGWEPMTLDEAWDTIAEMCEKGRAT